MSEISILRLVEQIPDEAAAYAYLEELRWDGRPECPHCGNDDRCYFLTPRNGSTRATRTGAATQRRLWKCGACRKQFSVLTNSVMHGTKIPVRTWVFVLFEMCASKNGVSAREIERKYDLTPRSAWFMTHRIREAMKADGLGMFVGVVVADETYIGGSEKNKHKGVRPARIRQSTEPVQIVPGERPARNRGPKGDKVSVLSLIEQRTGEVRSVVVPDVTGHTLRKAIAEQVDLPNTVLYTDEAAGYKALAAELAAHETVNHSEDEYVRYESGAVITTNAAEGYFSQLKRSIDGTHHHVSTEHLPRYLAEFDFRYTTRKMSDTARVGKLVGRVGGRRLTYRPLTSSAKAS